MHGPGHLRTQRKPLDYKYLSLELNRFTVQKWDRGWKWGSGDGGIRARKFALPSDEDKARIRTVFRPHLHVGSLFGMIEKFREYSFLLLRYHCECSQSGRGW